MEQVTTTGFAVFAPRARLLRLIGAELISDDVVAVTELVKNAHDADASFVSIQFVGATAGDGEIIIRDDGYGMDLDTLLTRWMQPAGSMKGRLASRFTGKGRRVLGEKGVGRFAADKLASGLELVSRRTGASTEIRAVFDWGSFDADERMLSDVPSRWDVRPAEWLETSGTVLRLTGLRTRWTERLFRRLSARLSRLVSPLAGSAGFRIEIASDEFPQYAGEISGGFLDRAPYRIEAEFDGKAAIAVRMNGQECCETWTDAPLSCGPVRTRLFAFDLETEALARVGPRADVRAWLREWTGISVYRDGFRVWPYGEPHDDWLRLDQRRVNNPVVCLSTNQIVGFVEIMADRNAELRDQTNREGLIHNGAFLDLQRLVLFVLQMLEAERQSTRHPEHRASPDLQAEGTGAGESAVASALEKVAAQLPEAAATEIRRAATRTKQNVAARDAIHRRMLEGYVELAIAGQLGSIVGRHVESQLAELEKMVGARQEPESERSNAAVRGSAVRSLLASIRASTGLLVQPANSVMKRRRGLDLRAELERAQALLTPALKGYGGDMIVEAPPRVVLRTEMRPEVFHALLGTLVENSIDWASPARPLHVTATLCEAGGSIELLVSDNGRGVLQTLERKLFDPMVSGKQGGRGMGLALARNVVTAHGGTIGLVRDARRRGATFRILFPRKRSRATSNHV